MDHEEYGDFPLRRFLGMDVEVVEPGNAVARLVVGEALLNPNGAVHGGVIFTMVDTAMGKATMTSLEDGQLCASIEIQIRFLRPVRDGQLEANAKVIRRGRRVIHLEARVHNAEGDLAATGTGTFAVLASR